MTIQSTCHPHSQAASSSLLTNEGGGVGEADTEGGGRRGQTRRCEKRGREAKRKAQCGAEAAGSDRPEGQRARGPEDRGRGWSPDSEKRADNRSRLNSAPERGWVRGHKGMGRQACPPNTCSPAKRRAREGQVPPRARAGRGKQALGAWTGPRPHWDGASGLLRAGRPPGRAEVNTRPRSPVGPPGDHLCSHPNLELTALLATLLAPQPSSPQAGTCGSALWKVRWAGEPSDGPKQREGAGARGPWGTHREPSSANSEVASSGGQCPVLTPPAGSPHRSPAPLWCPSSVPPLPQPGQPLRPTQGSSVCFQRHRRCPSSP